MALAERTGGEILSVDSMQVYRGMDIGTAKPSSEEQRIVRHHMVDLVEPEETYTVAQFRHDARAALAASQSPVLLIVGGSGLHFRSVVDPMTFRPSDPSVRAEVDAADSADLVDELLTADPEAAVHVDLANPRRVRKAVEALRVAGMTPTGWAGSTERQRYDSYLPELEFVGFAIDRPDIAGAVGERLDDMRRRGFLAEVERLMPHLGPTASQAVGYSQLLDVVEGRISEAEGFLEVRRATMRLVKRQRTFFRRDPRLRWFDPSTKDVLEHVLKEARL